MLIEHTLDKLQAMKLHGFAAALKEQLNSPECARLSVEDRLGLLVDAEWTAREQRSLARRRRAAKFRYAACIEDLDYQAARGLDRKVVLSLAHGVWIREKQNLVITGPTGAGKSYLACAFGEQACRTGFNVLYSRAPRLLKDLIVAHGDGSYGRLLARWAKLDLLILDDWLLAALKDQERQDLLEVVEDRAERRSTLIATVVPVKNWHEMIGEPTLADSILDRLVHGAHKIELRGGSQRAARAARKRPPERT